MSTEFFNDQWRIPSNENQNKVSNYSMEFNGASSRIEFGDVNGFERTDSFSFSLWVNIPFYGTYYYISKQLSSGQFTGYNLFCTSNGKLQFLLNNNFNSNTLYVTSTSQIPLNQWVHLTLTYDGSSLASGVNMYFNGVSETIITVNNNLTATTLNTTEFQISGRDGGNGNITGKIDQVTVFDYALSQDQVTQLGAEGYAFKFIPNDRINIGSASTSNITGSLTLSIWMKSTSTAIQGLISKNGNTAGTKIFALYLGVASGNDVLYSWVSSDGSTLSATNITLSGRQITDGNWHNIIMVNDPTTTNNYLYVDGQQVRASTQGTTIHSSAIDTLIGAYTTSLYPFNGELSNAQIFNSVIPPTGSNSVQTIYNNGKPLTNMSGFTSLQGWWKLDDTEIFNTTSTEWSVDNNSYPSTYKSSLNFNSDYIRVNSFIFGGLTSLSISCWYNLSSISTDQGIIARWTSNPRSILLYHDAPNGWRFLINGVESFQSTHIASVNTWQHLVVVYESGAATKIYLNGVSQVKPSVVSGAIPVSTSWDIGRDGGTNTKNLNGELSNLAIWDTALTDPQVQTIYNNGAPEASISHSPTSWYKLDNTTTGIQDSVGSNNGTNNGATEYAGFVNTLAGESVGMDSSNLVASNINGELIANPMATSPKPIAYYQLGDQSVYNGGGYLVPNNSLSGYVFRSVPAQTTSIIPPNTITSDINYTGTPASPSGFTVSLWIKGIGPFGSGQQQLIFDHNSSTHTSATSQGVFSFDSGSILFLFGSGTYRYYSIPSGIDFDEWNNIVVYFQPGNRSAGKVWINGGTPLSLSTGAGSSYNDFTAGFRLYLNSFNSNVMYFKDYEIDNAGATLLYNNGAPLLDTSTLAQAPDHWWKLNDDDTFNSGTSTWTINDYVGSENGTSVNMTSNNLVISDLDNTGSSVGYSPYALDFDGVDDYLTITSTDFKGSAGTVSYSFWVKPETYGNPSGTQNFGYFTSNSSTGGGIAYSEGGTGFGLTPGQMYLYNMTNAGLVPTLTSTIIDDNVWNNIVIVFNTGNIVQFYKNGSLSSTITGVTSFNATWDTIAARRYPGGLNNPINGDLSNFSIFDTALTFSEVTEIYNQGVVSNLHNFSGTAPVSWWQLGSNSSYNSSAWTCLDEIGANNAVSGGGMTNDAITNGPGYSASGLGTSSIDIKGDAPYSTANGLSENMDVLDRTTDVPS